MQPETERRLRISWLIGAILLSLVSYHLLIYQTSRTDFSSILFHYVVLALVYLLVIRVAANQLLYLALAGAMIIRVFLIAAVPELSDDFYRFIWDGRLLHIGVSPFTQLPSELMRNPDFSGDLINQQLYQGMNSPDYFTVYPPLAQWVFYLSTWLFPRDIVGNLVIMRLIIIAFEAGSIWLMIRILNQYRLSANNVLAYAWNPLVIVELTGNLHFEAVMIFFVLLAIYLLVTGYWKWSAISMAAGIAAKLIPLIFLPLLILRMPWKKLIAYWLICGMVTVLLFFTIWSPELIDGMSTSLSLYFQKFEFNASIYFVIREIGFSVAGYNIIGTAGKYLALFTLLVILGFAWWSHQRMNCPQAMIWALTLYLLMSTTVHPWYLTTLVALSVFTGYKFPIAWSVLVVLSYAGYTESGYSENMALVMVEYLLLVIVMIFDISGRSNSNLKQSKLVGVV